MRDSSPMRVKCRMLEIEIHSPAAVSGFAQEDTMSRTSHYEGGSQNPRNEFLGDVLIGANVANLGI